VADHVADAGEVAMSEMAPPMLGAVELRERLASGALAAETLVERCLERIAAREEAVGAWAWLDAEHALGQARARDAERRRGRPVGALHGLPVALKDIIDTRGIPTANGTALDAARVPTEDAWVARRLAAEGAILLGKSVTAELAYLHPGKTRNPVNADHTPGGSSSGSAAAVADRMVPLAVGTQTGGSVIRPAAYCGTVGFKPTFGTIPRTGILSQSPSLDTVGVFATDVEGAALLVDALSGHDPGDPASAPRPFPRLLETARAEPPVEPVLAVVKTPFWSRADEDTRAALAELTRLLGEEHCFEAELPERFAESAAVRERINLAEMAKNFHAWHARGAEHLGALTREAIERGRTISAHDYLAALDWSGILNAALEALFERCDAILTPAATGAAPAGLTSTGDSIFNGLWTLCGTPAITLPLLEASNGLPMGVQLVGRRGDDARLLRTARWLVGRVEEAGE